MTVTMDIDAELFARRGVAIVEELLTPSQCDVLIELCEPLLLHGASDRRPGVRRVLQRAPAIIHVLRQSRFPALARAVCGAEVRIVRSILFDKSPTANWLAPWHQDATIAVANRVDLPGFGPWSVKDGEHHCRPPRVVLDRIVVIRLSLDPCGPANGPLRIVAGSHQRGLLAAEDAARAASSGEIVECCTGRGSAVVMFPHSVHASAKAAEPTRRRVLHLECTGASLPASLCWAESVELAAVVGTLAQ